MRLSRLLPVGLFALGVAAIAAGAACGGGDDAAAETGTASATAAASPSSTATRSATATTARPTNTPTAVPTPTPYNGAVSRIRVPRLSIDAPIEELAVSADGQMAAPSVGRELTHVGWYFQWDKPGRLNPGNRGWMDFGGKTEVNGFYGNSVFSAHVYYNLGVPAPFQRLAQAQDGDEVIITMEDGREYTYVVFAESQYHRDAFPGGEVVWPTVKPDNEEWITLITCGGALDASGVEYLYRDVVVARRLP